MRRAGLTPGWGVQALCARQRSVAHWCMICQLAYWVWLLTHQLCFSQARWPQQPQSQPLQGTGQGQGLGPEQGLPGQGQGKRPGKGQR